MEEIIKQFHEKFPPLSHLTVTEAKNNSIAETLPLFFGFLLAVMETPPDQPLCFVFPRRGDVARIASVLHALSKFQQCHQESVRTLVEQELKEGQTVRICPWEEVFVYEGIRDSDPNHFWLSELDLSRPPRNGYRTKFPVKMNFPLRTIQRLAPTTRKRPKGNIRERGNALLEPPEAEIDRLLDTVTFGNFLGDVNEVILLDSQSGFAEFSKGIALQKKQQTSSASSLKELLPFGELVQPTSSEKSWLKMWDDQNMAGEPLVAIAHSAELLANYCIDAPSKSKLIVINGLSRLKQRQSYDDMAESQRLVLFASRDEEEMIETLGNAPVPCKFWWLSAAEMNAGLQAATATGLSGAVSQVIRWANNQKQMTIEAVPCENQGLEAVCLYLEELRSQLGNDENDPLTKLTSHAWRILNEASSVVRPLTDDEQQKFASQISRLRMETINNVWLKPDCVSALNNFANAIEACVASDGKLGLNKGAELYRVVRESQAAQLKCALLARNENQIAELKLWLRQRSILLETYSPRTLPDDSFFDRLICVSWPGWHSLKQIADALVSPRISVLAYPFERRWLNQCKRRLQQSPDVPRVTAAEKSKLVFRNETTPTIWLDENKEDPSPPSPPLSDIGIWHFEQRLRTARKGSAATSVISGDIIAARYVSFVGDSYAFLTESHKLPVVTNLVSGSVRASEKLPERTCVDFKPGDFIVFPESGDREFLQTVADKVIGATAPELRKLAKKWQDALQRSELTPQQFHRQAKELDHSRHPLTIRKWFDNSSQIGPREKDDLVLIALVTGNKEFEAEIDAVRQAIEKLWSAHHSAGHRLRDALLQRLPQVMGQVEENGTQVDLDELGSAWIVQVDAFASSDELRGRSEVNRLLFD